MLNITVKFFFSFFEPFGANQTPVKLDSPADIKALLNTICDSDERRKKILNSSGELLPNIIILRNGKHITDLNGIKTELKDGDEITIFHPLGGG